VKPAKEFLGFPEDRRQALFGEAATRRGVDPVIMEKDFWVCWLLALLFTDGEIAPHLVFKGGTSLSKVFRVIDRFSEDVDLSVSPEFVEADVKAYETASSRTKHDEAMLAMQAQCAKKVQAIIQPRLEGRIAEYLGAKSKGTWLTYEENAQAKSPNLYFHFPSVGQGRRLSYIRPAVLLEMGSITDQQPVGKHSVKPWIAETLPEAFRDWACDVTALELSRTFWEKGTILHSEYHRPAEQPMPERYARHYYDFARMLGHSEAKVFMADKDLARRVAAWKSKVFARTWANYDKAIHGTYRLVPPKERLGALEDDYGKMRPFFMSEPPRFAQLIERISEAEGRLNAT
jgi:hypothetical protein